MSKILDTIILLRGRKFTEFFLDLIYHSDCVIFEFVNIFILFNLNNMLIFFI